MEKKKSGEEHEKTCFRCRLHNLIVELYPKGFDEEEGKFLLIALAEASGQLLARMEEENRFLFMQALIKYSLEVECEDGEHGTMH
jgi:hypothetical protein